jgi:hypothetical protein
MVKGEVRLLKGHESTEEKIGYGYTLSLISVLDSGSCHASVALPPEKQVPTILEAGWTSGSVRKFSSPQELEPQPVQHVASLYAVPAAHVA